MPSKFVYVTSELKTSCFVSFLYAPWYELSYVWKKFIYLTAVLKFITIQNGPEQAETK